MLLSDQPLDLLLEARAGLVVLGDDEDGVVAGDAAEHAVGTGRVDGSGDALSGTGTADDDHLVARTWALTTVLRWDISGST